MQTFAHYYGSKSKGFMVRINNDPRPVGGIEYKVKGKAEAKQIAKANNATPYNF